MTVKCSSVMLLLQLLLSAFKLVIFHNHVWCWFQSLHALPALEFDEMKQVLSSSVIYCSCHFLSETRDTTESVSIQHLIQCTSFLGEPFQMMNCTVLVVALNTK